uniref:Uncharacterized protein n=1 Tax=Lotus japonicus TaxID=34305 RepID=I3SEM0_LOTJA|nr:unknown [Lotus japonicus]
MKQAIPSTISSCLTRTKSSWSNSEPSQRSFSLTKSQELPSSAAFSKTDA